MNTIASIPDTEFKELGFKGWIPFKEHFLNIWNHFIKYGEEVLRVDLGESREIYKQIFIEAGNSEEKFKSLLRKIWKERYHYVADNFIELIEFFEISEREGINIGYIYPEAIYHKYDNETKGENEVFAMSMWFYSHILETMSSLKDRNLFISIRKKDIYKISLGIDYSCTTYKKISIEKVDVIQIE